MQTLTPQKQEKLTFFIFIMHGYVVATFDRRLSPQKCENYSVFMFFYYVLTSRACDGSLGLVPL